jgi:sugar-specific transcriptional regulator TrmB
MQKELEQLGLSEKEAKIYLASLELGPATADQLAKHAKIVRPTTYVQIKSLMGMGLMSTYEEGKKTFFAPESPGALSLLLEKQKEGLRTNESLLGKLLPIITRQYEGTGERPIVRFFHGKKGVSAMREEALHDLKDGETLRVLYSYDALFNVFTEEEADKFSTAREDRGIHLKLLYTGSNGKRAIDTRGKNSERGYFPPGKLNLGTDLFIFKNKVAIMALSGKIFGILIESKVIAESMNSVFDLLWETSEKE